MELPSVPDSIYKISLLMTVAIVLALAHKENQIREQGEASYKKYLNDYEEEKSKIYKNTEKLNAIKLKVNSLAYLNDIESPMQDHDSFTTWAWPARKNRTIDSIYGLYLDYKQTLFQNDLYSKKIEILNRSLVDVYEGKSYLIVGYAMSVCLFLFSMLGLMREYSEKTEYSQRQLAQLPKSYRYCQSCGKFFSSLILFGTEKDGSLNKCFCMSCYGKGEFVEPDLKMNDILKRLKSRSFNWIHYRVIKKRIKELDRWNTSQW